MIFLGNATLVIAGENEHSDNATRRAMRRTRVGKYYVLVDASSCSVWHRVHGGADLVRRHENVRTQTSAHGAVQYSLQVFSLQTPCSLVADYCLGHGRLVCARAKSGARL